ncbi:cytochrome-c oxidase, cbb3-type subunit III [Aurantiacibacter sp. MUD11]|uniref:cytochrome-c oxidase, cbb3-type subunit III n=1 Tax=Aurantiacibacter sp. MUD11 TaxID=3003265 RepID=UPI0022AA1751|nr:cytochrome-c oxidase, cbb3-type subunit III [Aurantiacibacter sp. MUD11]WAT18179.1 cytochrome-c oxidase, cbb3-type subunit III [Aurantiacibacter sp. MUD11]
MGNKRVDEPTGTEFVGHEWDGIEELNTPLPRWWLWTFYATCVWALVYVILYPAWPLIEKGTEGVLGWSSRGELAEELAAADMARASFREQLVATPLERLQGDDPLLQQAVAGGRAAFQIHCTQCHGAGAAGSQELGYPNLNDDDWLWGGDIRAIEYTLVHGIRQDGDPETRTSQMPAYEGAFDRAQLDALVDHVQSLSGLAEPNAVGAELYASNCALCHGAAGEGDRQFGAPRLNDAIWLRGGDRQAIAAQILNPRMGMMPKWEGRLDEATIKMLAAYVHSLGGGEDFVEVAADPAVEVDEQP